MCIVCPFSPDWASGRFPLVTTCALCARSLPIGRAGDFRLSQHVHYVPVLSRLGERAISACQNMCIMCPFSPDRANGRFPLVRTCAVCARSLPIGRTGDFRLSEHVHCVPVLSRLGERAISACHNMCIVCPFSPDWASGRFPLVTTCALCARSLPIGRTGDFRLSEHVHYVPVLSRSGERAISACQNMCIMCPFSPDWANGRFPLAEHVHYVPALSRLGERSIPA